MTTTIDNKCFNSKDSYKNMKKLANNLNLFCQEAQQISSKVLYIMSKSGYIKNNDTWKQISRTQSA